MTRLRHIARSVLTSACLLVVVLVAAATPASAHTVSGQGSTNFQPRIVSITPPASGLTVQTIELGSRVQLTWTGADHLIVDGYEGEPYLRIGPDGIFRNRRSPATYLNQTRYGGVTIPPDADPKAAPDWVKIGSGHTVLWHDHRTHWMGGVLPPEVRNAPGSRHTVFTWKIDMVRVDSAGVSNPVVVNGILEWVPASSAWPWIALLVLAAALGIIAGLTRLWAYALLAITGILVAADVTHALGTGLAYGGSTGHRLLLVIGGSYYSIVAWVLGIVGIRLLAKRSLDGLFAAVFAGIVIGLFGGLADIGSLTHSQIPFDFGAATARLLVSVSVGGSAGLVVGSIVAFRRNREMASLEDAASEADEAAGADV